jgi:trk system potassium uptake protein
MNYPIIFKLLGIILVALGIAFCLSLGVGLLCASDSNEKHALLGFGISIVIAWGLAFVFFLLGRKGDNKILRKEALCVIGLGWILAILIGALPYLIVLDDCRISDAVFESASGLTTTGASVFSHLESFPKSLLFWRAMSQWIGGLGVVVFFVAIFSFLGVGAKNLFSAESSARPTDITSSRMQSGIIQILLYYLALSGICALSFHWAGMSWFDAFCHMYTTISTGGFSTHNASIAYFQNPLIEWLVIVFMVLGATSFLVILPIFQGKLDTIRKSTETAVFYVILICSSLVVAFYSLNDISDLNNALRTSTFHVVSIMTTSGFTTVDYDTWASFTHIIFLALMIIGGCSGSTAGGIKVIRFVVALKMSMFNIEKSFRTHVVRPVKINGRNLSYSVTEGVINYIIIIVLISYLSLILISLFEPDLSFKGTFSAAIACLHNVGPGFQEVGPTKIYQPFHDITKYFLALLMVMGRLELYAILVLFCPSLWKRFF